MEQPIPVKEVGYFLQNKGGRESDTFEWLFKLQLFGIKLFSIYNYNDFSFLYEK